MKHTPEPWFVSSAYGDGSALWISPEIGPKMVLQGANCLRSDSVKYEQISVDQLQANATLIVAAPELLDIVRDLLSQIRGYQNCNGDKGFVLTDADAVVAKARGISA